LNRSIVNNYCTLRDNNKKACHIKACQTYSKHIILSNCGATQMLRGTGKLHPFLDGHVDQCFIWTSGIVVVSRYSKPETVSLSWLQFQVSHNTSCD